MTEKINCKIIEDLLVNYIEGLTNEYTTKCVENHLEECDQCKKQYNSMKDNITLPPDSIEANMNNSRKLNRFLGKIKRKNAIIVAVISIVIVSAIWIAGLNYYSYYYQTASIAVPAEEIVVLKAGENDDGTFYYKVAATSDYEIIGSSLNYNAAEKSMLLTFYRPRVKKEYTGGDKYSYMDENYKVGYSPDGNVEVKNINYVDENGNTVSVYSVDK